MSKQTSLKELNQLTEKLFAEDWYPKKLPNGMWEVAKGVITNERGLELFYKAFNHETIDKVIKKYETNRK